jgi:hypothetical protein
MNGDTWLFEGHVKTIRFPGALPGKPVAKETKLRIFRRDKSFISLAIKELSYFLGLAIEFKLCKFRQIWKTAICTYQSAVGSCEFPRLKIHGYREKCVPSMLTECWEKL